jgi:hypothetical protein
MDGIIDDNKLLEWGRMVHEKAKLIRKYEIHHTNKLNEVLNEIKTNNDIEELGLDKLFEKNRDKITSGILLELVKLYEYGGYRIKGYELRGDTFSDDHTAVNVYWLESILNFYNYEYSETDALIDIVEKRIFCNIFEKFKEGDFYFNEKNDLIYQLSWNSSAKKDGVSIQVPYSIGKLKLELLIRVVSAITKNYINRIYLFYFNEEDDELIEELGGPPCELFDIYFFDTDLINEIRRFQDRPYMKSSEFINKKFTDLNSWYLEVPQFKKYIDDYNKPQEEFPF